VSVDSGTLLAVIRASWSAETTDDWHPDDPARHQCGVSALVVQDYLGGQVVTNVFGGRAVWFNELPDGTELSAAGDFGQRDYPENRVRTRAQLMRHPDMPRRHAVLAARVAALL
jgi:hypothetical protein